MLLLHKHGMGAELMATFNNGIAYQFLKGDTLTTESVARPDTYPKVTSVHAFYVRFELKARLNSIFRNSMHRRVFSLIKKIPVIYLWRALGTNLKN